MVWDWSIRVFHWLFAFTITVALGIALLVDEHSPLFEWHMLLGLCAGFLLIMRLALFIFGSRPENITGLLAAFRSAPAYFRHLRGMPSKCHGGHNPLAWVVYLAMFLLLAGTVWTGINMQTELAEDLHELFAYGLLATIAAHLIGLVFHTLRFRENIAMSMIDGRKKAQPAERIRSAKPILGAIILLLCLVFMGQLFARYQPGSGQVQIPWIGWVITLGENESDEASDSDDNDDHDNDNDAHGRESACLSPRDGLMCSANG